MVSVDAGSMLFDSKRILLLALSVNEEEQEITTAMTNIKRISYKMIHLFNCYCTTQTTDIHQRSAIKLSIKRRHEERLWHSIIKDFILWKGHKNYKFIWHFFSKIQVFSWFTQEKFIKNTRLVAWFGFKSSSVWFKFRNGKKLVYKWETMKFF